MDRKWMGRDKWTDNEWIETQIDRQWMDRDINEQKMDG